MRESNLQAKCIDYLKVKKIYYINIHGSGWGAKGAPDLIACINGKFVAFEFKVGNNEMQPDQRLHKKRIEANKGLHYCPRSVGEFIEIIKKNDRRRQL